MMQIFSLKLADYSFDTAPAGPIQLYGFMAVRDLLQPLRNYVFNCTRDDPLVIHPHSDEDASSPLLIQMAGPKRGIYLQARALIEYDLRIKRGQQEEDEDLQLIDGAATFSELTPFHGVYTRRIHGGCGAVDISLALLRHAVEARIQVAISQLPELGLRLSLAFFVSDIPQEILLFEGVVDKPGDLTKSFVVAVVIRSHLVLDFKVKQAGGNDQVIRRLCALPAKPHGRSQKSLSLDIATAKVQVSWANLLNT